MLRKSEKLAFIEGIWPTICVDVGGSVALSGIFDCALRIAKGVWGIKTLAPLHN